MLGPASPTRLLLADAGRDLEFAFRVADPAPAVVYLTASVYSMRGERVADLVRDERRSARTLQEPFGRFGDPARDRWDGRDLAGQPVPGGMYVLRVSAGTSPGVTTSRQQRTIAVVR
ncbi:MAG: hypothetical protein ACE5G2_12110 [Candidatus Krumholzibacteriia bacterium]